MQPISQWTLGEITEGLKNLTIMSAVVTVVWKVRGGWEYIKKFLTKLSEVMDKVPKHMEAMETGMSELLNNHLSHLKAEKRDYVEIPEDELPR